MNLNLAVKNKAYPGAPLGSGSGASGQSGASGASGQSGAFGGSGQSGASGGSGQSGTSGGSGQSGASGGSGQTVFFSSVSKQKPYLVKISVKNKPEPPKFRPKVKPISVSENTKGSISKVIDIYPAVEEDTGKPAENVKWVFFKILLSKQQNKSLKILPFINKNNWLNMQDSACPTLLWALSKTLRMGGPIETR